MIDYIRGLLTDISPTQAIIEANGVGYALSISLNTYTAIQGKDEVKLFVFESIREDAFQLFGFASKQERSLFSLLVAISGIGGMTARMILSAFTPSDLARIVETEDVKSLKNVKGIGPKAAGRIIVELKDKVATIYANIPNSSSKGINKSYIASPKVNEAVQALSVLGFPPAVAQKVVLTVVNEDESSPVEDIIKKSLKLL